MNTSHSGIVDMHVHSAPSLFPRQFNDFYLGKMAVKYNMKGFVIKDHDSITSNRAYLVNEYIGEKRAYGSMVFNHSQGGFNRRVFQTAINYGIKVAWMPTNQSLYHITNFGGNDYSKLKRDKKLPDWPGIYILNREGNVKDNVLDILDMAKENSICIGTGHLSHKEIFALVNSSSSALRKKTVVTHINWDIFRMSDSEIGELKAKGVYFELTLAPIYSNQFRSEIIEDFAKMIRIIGVDKCIISSDLGQIGNIDPAEAVNKAWKELENVGLSNNELEKLFSSNAENFLTI